MISAYHYDEAGYPIRREGDDTLLEQQWQHGQLKQLSIGQHTPLRFYHNHLGLETQRESAQGFQLQHQWSQHGQLKQQQLGNQTLRDYHYDALDRIIGIHDSHWGNTELTLNPNGQISAQRQIRKDNREQVQLFGYDSELNLNHQSSVPATNNVVDLAQKRDEKSHQYDNAGRVLKRGAFSYRYDECGRVVEKTQHKAGYRPQITRFVWNEDDQLIKAELPNQERWRYRYDPFGRRIAKECEQSESINTHYRWDGDNLIGQQKIFADGTPLTSTEYIYEPDSFRPVAQVDTNHLQQTSSLRYIITDHAGTPRELCNEQGDILWRGEQEIWGRYQQRKAANDAIECDLRYQGQIYDRETGLYYNRHRYYDRDSGQYLSSDPIGMAGGLRPQAYVQNPLEWVDPLGLAECPGVTKGAGRKLPFADKDRLTEINKTLDRIESNGPFPHKRDGITFKNRAGKLPEGNYKEYTVDTPGASNRGARRVVQDLNTGKTYYTDDHYENFTQIDPKKY